MNANNFLIRCFSLFRDEYEPQSTNIKIIPTALFNYLLWIIICYECKAEANTGIPVRDSSNVFASALHSFAW